MNDLAFSATTSPLVSVVIPSFQRANTLPRAIQSVLNQTYPHFEVIIVDDGSTDNTREIVEKSCLLDKRIRYIFQHNQGPGAARNTGMQHASGEYIAFLDADDEWEPYKLAGQVKIFQDFPWLYFQFADCRNINAHTQRSNLLSEANALIFSRLMQYARKLNSILVFQRPVERVLLWRTFLLTSTVMIRRQVVESVGLFDTRWRGPEDVDYWIRCAVTYGEIGYWPEVVAKRYHDTRSITWIRDTTLLEKIRFCKDCLESELYASLHPIIWRKIRSVYRALIRLYGEQQMRQKAWRTFRESLAFGFDPRVLIYLIGAFAGPSSFSLVDRLISFKLRIAGSETLHILEEMEQQ